MPRPDSPRDREHARASARQDAEDRRHATARRRQRLVAVIALVVVVALVAGVVGSLFTAGRSTTSPPAPTPTSAPGPTAEQVDFPEPAPGAQLTAPTPCPAEDGSSPRTTSFAGPPPMCIDPAGAYQAVVRTSVGDLTLTLDPAAAPAEVNNFVVLARYHYYEGQPFTAVLPQAAAVVRGIFAPGPGNPPTPGYTVPGQPPASQPPLAAGQLAFIPEDDSGAFAATLILTTFEGAASLPGGLTPLGTIVAGQEALAAIDRAGTDTGVPTQLITITSVEVTGSRPID